MHFLIDLHVFFLLRINTIQHLITVINCYILFIRGWRLVILNIIVSKSSMIPIYEQIVDQIKALIRDGKLKENDALPSVRTLSKELKISALTVKKAYDTLESEGFAITVHGKGTYIATTNKELLLEEQKKELETDLEQAIQKGRRYGISDDDIKELFELILEG